MTRGETDAALGTGGTPVEATPSSLRAAIQGVLWNASNYPERVQPRILGQDIKPLSDKVLDAILGWLATHDAEIRADERRRVLAEQDAEREAARVASAPRDSEAHTWSTLNLPSDRYDPAWLRCKHVGPHNDHEDADHGFTWRHPEAPR